MKKIIALLLTLCVTVAAAPEVNVVLSWDYAPEELTDDITFRLYHSTDISRPVDTWDLITTVPHTQLSLVLPIVPGKHFFIMKAYSTFWGAESVPSNLALTPALPRNPNLSIRKES